VRRVKVQGKALEPYRVDLRKASDSVLTEILEGISRCRFFLADITVVGELDGRPVRNANVLYEVGLAHATRLPVAVPRLRSDDKGLLFDVMNVPVLEYHPDGAPEAAQNLVADAINGVAQRARPQTVVVGETCGGVARVSEEPGPVAHEEQIACRSPDGPR